MEKRRARDLRLGKEYRNTIEVQTRKQNPERVGAPGELGNKDISPGSSDMNTIEAQTRRHNPERVNAAGERPKLRIHKEFSTEKRAPG